MTCVLTLLAEHQEEHPACKQLGDEVVAHLTASTFNRLDQYTSSPGNGAFCYAEAAGSSLVVAET